ncbi:inner membrane protein [alpha proteobacterium U9-1i]|nr:inner membrane protein [alpha proteobacterium U9-1i]
MLLHDAGLAWLHFLFAFVLVGAVVTELFILRLPVNAQTARLLVRVDAFYGGSSVLLILAGISRVVWGAKGWGYYQAEPFFWAKMATFAIIGLISIAPTRTFLRWLKAANADAHFIAPEAEVKSARRIVMFEVHGVALLLLFASLMARGIGLG